MNVLGVFAGTSWGIPIPLTVSLSTMEAFSPIGFDPLAAFTGPALQAGGGITLPVLSLTGLNHLGLENQYSPGATFWVLGPSVARAVNNTVSPIGEAGLGLYSGISLTLPA